ncbi:MAG: phenylacetate--CoA ligase family protein [Spirochaetes bacterium]|nr:phenylacetate--CoA ligase family protein [Spirochaetota bacterium]
MMKINSRPDSLINQRLDEYQLEKLQETIDFVYNNSPFYHDRLRDFAEHKLTCLNDLTRLPFTIQEDIEASALQMLCVSQSDISRVVTLDTSGTTRKPKRLYFTREDQELTVDFFKTGMSTFTEQGDHVMILLPGERPGSVGDLLAVSIERLGAIPIKHGIIHSIPETIQILADTKANVAVGIPIQMIALARYYEQNNYNPKLTLQRLLVSTDYLPNAVRSELQRILGCEIFDHYGMTEMGLGGGVECCAHNGYHMREADLFFEIIDPQTGKTVPYGNYGEVVFTTLTRNGMPLIRYRTGDLSRIIPGTCQCGTSLYRLDYIKTRNSGRIQIDDECYFSISDLDEILLAIPGIVDFSAKIFYQTSSVLLKIEIITMEKPIPKTSIYESLYTIPAINILKKKSGLTILIESFTCNNTYIPKAGKRKILVS